MRTHEFTRTWGDDYTFTPLDGGQRGTVTGWKEGIKTGDYLILRNGDGTTRYQTTYVQYFDDPTDMFSAEVKFAPRN